MKLAPRCVGGVLLPCGGAASATASLQTSACRRQRRWDGIATVSTANLQYLNPSAGDEDVNFMVHHKKAQNVKLMSYLPNEFATKTRLMTGQDFRFPATNVTQAHLKAQCEKTSNEVHPVQIFDPVFEEEGVPGLWHYPFFFSQSEQEELQAEAAPLFRSAQHSVRVKNTCTLMRNSYTVRGPCNTKTDSQMPHTWQERNHPSITRVGRRNLVHACEARCEARKANFVDLQRGTPCLASALDKVWDYFGSGGDNTCPSGAVWGSKNVEWHPRLDRRPNMARLSEWLECDTGMNSHVKPPAFGNYVGIINLHSPTVLQFVHDPKQLEEGGNRALWIDEETPTGQLRTSKVVLLPGSLTLLKYDARWRIATGYSYEAEHVFRINTFPKDYRTSIMFAHYSKTEPGKADMTPDMFRECYEDDAGPAPRNLDPCFASRTERTTGPRAVAYVP